MKFPTVDGDRNRAASALIAAALALAGCGGGDEAAEPTPAASTPAPTEAPGIEIVRPDAGTKVRAGATVAVGGRAAPEATVLVSSGCVVYGCNDLARAASDGRWRAEVRVGRRPATIEAANSADPRDVDRVRVRVRAPRRPPARKPTPAATPPPVAQAPLPPAAAGGRGPRRLVMIGDSLAVGTEAILPGLLPGWRVETHGLTSRPLSAGMQLLSTVALGNRPKVLAFSLFTNDDPRNVGALEAAVRTSVARAGPRGCAVWATIVRPPVNGVSYRAANRRLRALARDPALAGHLRIVPWAAEVARHPDWLASDGVHGTPAGYAGRAQLYARAALSC